MTEGERLREYMKINKIGVSELMKKIGAKSRTTVYKYYATKRFSEEVARTLKDAIGFDVYSNVNILVEEPSESYQKRVGGNTPGDDQVKIPFYDIDFIAGNALEESDGVISHPTHYLTYPDYSGCIAFKIHSDSMDPLIKSSSTVFATKVEDFNILEYGEIYGIVLKDGRRLLKYVKRSLKAPEPHFELISHNEFYDPMTIPKDIIKSMWLIHGWVHRKL